MSPSTIQPASSPDDVLLSLTDLSAIVGLGHTATKCLVRRPGFPNQVRLSQRVVRWWRSEVMAWLHEQRWTYQPVVAVPLSGTTPCPSIRRGRARRHH